MRIVSFVLACSVASVAFAEDAAPAVPAAPAAAKVPLSDFARHEKISNIKISPDGKYIAEARLIDGRAALGVVRLADKKVTATYNFGDERRIDNYWWVGPERLMLSFAEQHSAFLEPVGTGELVGLDADNTKGDSSTYLYGQRGTRWTTGTNLPGAQADDRWAEVIQPLSSEAGMAIVQLNDFTRFQSAGGVIGQALHVRTAEVDKIDVNNGYRRVIAHAPVAGETDFLTDHAGNAVYAVTEDKDFNELIFSKGPQDTDWKRLNPEGSSRSSFIPVAMSQDDHRAFLLATVGDGRRCVAEHDIISNSRLMLSCDDQADATGLVTSFDGKDVIAALYAGAPPWERLVDTDNGDKVALQKLMSAFPGQTVVPTSKTVDGSKVIMFVHSDRNPGDYYLFEPKTMKADYLESARGWIDPEQMSERRPIQYKARDGQLIHGILTLPRGSEARNLPMVVYPHGGPIGARDSWSWNADAQMLASRGYAVLQVNFRGSSGYGSKFRDAGSQGWDSVMIDDISDGTHWAVQQGYANASRLCIYGAAYGGYAAMTSAVKEPDLYRCVIGYAGIYDLVKWKHDSDVSNKFISDFVGGDDKLEAASPIKYIDRLKAAVMIVHGEADQEVPFSQAKELREALVARHQPPEWLSKANEGHGFFDEKDEAERYERMIAFLDQQIGPNAKVPQAAIAASADAATPAGK